jgi:hypothetical protein
MFRPRPTLPRPRSLHSNRCHPACPERSRRERSEGSAFLRRLATRHSPLATSPLSPFPSTLTSHAQLAENKNTLSPAVAILDAASSITPLFATLTKNTRGGGYRFCPLSFMASPTSHHSLPTISFTIRTYEKRARNPRRIRTSKTQDLKPFRIRTYRKTGRG